MALKIVPYWVNHLSIILLLTTVSCASQPPADIGLRDKKLRLCPNTPNCVSSEHKDKSFWVEPLAFKETPHVAWEKLKMAVNAIGGTIEKEERPYLWATFRTKVFRFVDDMEFRMDSEDKVIHLRSASRVGYSDLGVNMRRVKKLRAKFNPEKEK